MVNRTLNVISIQKTKRNESILKDWITDYDGIELFLLDHGLLIERREDTESNYFILVESGRNGLIFILLAIMKTIMMQRIFYVILPVCLIVVPL